ncbi:NACHT domain-containing protein [Paenibacillus sp. LMG 31456]|uniref:NACHT domain-containing protein n=1 Tax=Paenibacillus foliorum TaxID=2654974 RepID=A0A972GQ81_9BACL|nr:NACHT domain-containing protein [Paenibacillus foliorum]NOU94901.1 NACHT domain-containing protein [Paenibacillus foliorum]
MSDDLLIKAGITAVSSIVVEPIKHIINTWLKPKFEEMKKNSGINEKLEMFAFEVFEDYLVKTYEEQSSLNIIALGLQQIQLHEIYIPLTIYSEEKKQQLTITNYPEDLAHNYKKIVVEDTAGMGKSTLMKKMFISAIEQNVGIPIFIELRNLSKEKDIIDIILENLNKFSSKHDKDFILEVINRGDFIFFLDGYDEIPFQQKQFVTRGLKQFIGNASENVFFLTSRPDDSLNSFGQFQKFEIIELKQSEAFSLIEKCDKVTNLELSHKIISQINDSIESGQFSDLETFLGNPLLVSFLYLTFKHKKDIPSLKIEFYRKVYDALFELHDLSKDSYKREKYSGLTSGNLQRVLMKLGFLCLRENENDYDKSQLLKLISQAKSSPYFKDIQEEDIFKDLLETVPLFTTIGLSYKWAHKSFMEYFAAYFVDNQENREKILNDIYMSNNFSIFINMLDFYYEIDRRLFDKVFVYPIVKEFIDFVEGYEISTSEDTVFLEYLEVMYNRLVIFESNGRDRLKWSERQEALLQKYSGNFPGIKDYQMFKGVQSSNTTLLLIKNRRLENILNLLLTKNSNLVKSVKSDRSQNKNEGESLFFSYEINYLNQFNIEDIKNRLSIVKRAFGQDKTININRNRMGNRKVRSRELIALDYFEAKKYCSLIEEEIQNSQEEIFLNL